MRMTHIRCLSVSALGGLLMLLLAACGQPIPQPPPQPPVELPPSLAGFSDPLAEPYRNVMRKHPLPGVTPTVNTTMASLAATLERVLPENSLRFRYQFVNSLSVNVVGFADGEIVFTSGALAVFDEPDMLAALVAHQMAHLLAGHRLPAGTPSAPTSVYLYTLAVEERQLVSAMAAVRFTTAQESKADQLAIELLRRAGYDDQLYSVFLARMSAIAQEGFVLWDDSHPGLGQRLRALAPSYNAKHYKPLHDTASLRQALNGVTVYRHYTQTHINSEGVGFSDSGLVIRFGSDGEWEHLGKQTGRIRLGDREIRFRQFRGEDREEKMRQAFRSYNINAGGILSRLDRFRAKSWVTDDSCLLLESLALKPALLVFSETVAGNCDGVSHRGFAAITAEQHDGKQIAREFGVRLAYRRSTDAETNAVLREKLFGDANTPIDAVLNNAAQHQAQKKILY